MNLPFRLPPIAAAAFLTMSLLDGKLAAAGPASESGEPPARQLSRINETLSWQRVNPGDYAGQVEALLTEWARTDPAAALDMALKPLTDDNVHAIFLDAAGNAMESWARRDPVAARTFFEKLDKTAAKVLAPWVVRGYGSQVPESAMEWVHAGLGPDREELQPLMAKALTDVFEESGRREQLKYWLAMPGVAGSAYGAATAADFSRRLARANPREALGFVQDLPAGSGARGSSLHETLKQWAVGDPESARRWLAQSLDQNRSGTPSQELESAFSGYLKGLARSEPGKIFSNGLSIIDPALPAKMAQVLQAAP